MGLDVYVGPITRYTLGDWLTVVQKALQAQGHEVRIVRAEPESEDVIADPIAVTGAIRSWQQGLLQAIGESHGWAEAADLRYWTDKPDWDGYGGMVLLAAYDEQPELKPANRRGLVRRKAPADAPRAFQDAPAYQRASVDPVRYTTLLSGVEWWLPLHGGPQVFEAPRPTGQPTRMGHVDQLVSELEVLTSRLGIDDTQLERLRQTGPAEHDADAETAGRFGLAVFLDLAHCAQQNGQPLILDY